MLGFELDESEVFVYRRPAQLSLPKAIAFVVNVFLYLNHGFDLLILELGSASLTLQKLW